MPLTAPRILFVDESEDDFVLATAALRRGIRGARCERVDTAEGMRRALRAHDWEAIVCEEALPRLDCGAALALARESGCHAPFVVFSARRGPVKDSLGRRIGAAAVVDKADPERLARVIAREIARYAPVPLHDAPPAQPASPAQAAVPASELLLFAQPILTLATARPWGVELLVRRQDPQIGLGPAQNTAPLAGEPGRTVGDWLVDAAVAIAGGLAAAGRMDLRIAVNAPGARLGLAGWCEDVARELARAGAFADSLEFEVPEAWLFSHPRLAGRLATEARSRGLRLALDDFGSTYGALAALRAFTPRTLKLAPGLVREAQGGPGRDAALDGAIALARALGAHLLAGGVESAEQAARLQALGVDRIQGSYSPPVRVGSPAELLAALTAPQAQPEPAEARRKVR